MKRIGGGQELLKVLDDRTCKQYSIEASQDCNALISASPLTRIPAGGDILGDQSSRAMGSASSYYSTLGRAVNGNSATAAADDVGYVSGGSMVVRNKLDSATLRIPGWSHGVPTSRPSNNGSSSSGVLDQLGSVEVPDLGSQPATTTTTAGFIGNSSDAQVQSSSGSRDVCDQLGLVRVTTSGTSGDTTASSGSEGCHFWDLG